jgi:hypothetical protein
VNKNLSNGAVKKGTDKVIQDQKQCSKEKEKEKESEG